MSSLSRRSFTLALGAGALVAAPKKIPVGLEMYSVRNGLKTNPTETIRAVAKLGYDGVEFFSPYFTWTPEYAKQIRSLLDELNIRCFSTHNGPDSFTADGIPRAMELNKILGSSIIVMANAGHVETIDDWKRVAATLSDASERFRAEGLRAGYHNHQAEWKAVSGTRPMDILAVNTPKDFVLQLDVGTCLEVGVDPVDWINKNPGRIRSLHLKDWSPDPAKEYKVLFGEGAAPWKQIFHAAETTGGVEYYLIEQEGSRYSELESAERCLLSFRKVHGV